MSGTNQYGARDASVRLAKIRGAVRAVSKNSGIQTVRGGPSGSFSNPASNLIDTDLIASLGNVTLAPPATTPGAPTALAVVAGNGRLTITFTPGSDGGSPITNYQYSTDDWVSSTSFSLASDEISRVIITGLTNRTTYTIKFRAVNAVGAGTESSAVAGTPTTTPFTRSFKTVGSTSWTAPATVSSVQYLVVGGGGGGGGAWDQGASGGGGGGIVLTGTLPVVGGTVYTVVVGAGGARGIGTNSSTITSGSAGSQSRFASIIAPGGLGGQRVGTTSDNGGAGGSVGVVATLTPPGGGAGGQVWAGGAVGRAGGGGGGAGTAGGARPNTTTGGTAGSGISSTLSGSSIEYGRGGAGGTANAGSGTAGTANRGQGGSGGGGGGFSGFGAGVGGSGIVVIYYEE